MYCCISKIKMCIYIINYWWGILSNNHNNSIVNEQSMYTVNSKTPRRHIYGAMVFPSVYMFIDLYKIIYNAFTYIWLKEAVALKIS